MSSRPTAGAAGESKNVRLSRRSQKSPPTKVSEVVEQFRVAVADKAEADGVVALDPVNEKALGSQMRRWQRDGVTISELSHMVALFVDGPLPTRTPPWKVFAGNRAHLLQEVRDQGLGQPKTAAGRYTTDYWDGEGDD